MIPLRNDQPRFSTPYVTYFLIGLNMAVFHARSRPDAAKFQGPSLPVGNGACQHHGISDRNQPSGAGAGVPAYPDFHVSAWLMDARDRQHVVLWIFGDNVEDHLGHFKYLLFYLLSGLGAAFAQVILNPHSLVPRSGPAARSPAFWAHTSAVSGGQSVDLVPHFISVLFAGLGHARLLVRHAICERGRHLNRQLQRHRGGVAGIILIKLIPERPRRYRYGTW